MSEVLAITESVKLTSLKRRARRRGEQLDKKAERRPSGSVFPENSPIPDPSPVVAVGIDGAACAPMMPVSVKRGGLK